MTADKINSIGIYFRFVTPVFLGIIGSLILINLGNVSKQIEKIETHFTNHVSHHKDANADYNKFRISMEGRLASIETTLKIKNESKR